MEDLKYVLITDGSSDRIFQSIIDWTIDQHYPQLPKKGHWVDLRTIPCKTDKISEKIEWALKLYPADIIFYHRDAETTDILALKQRKNEIQNGIKDKDIIHRTICIVPIKMMETWLLFDAEAIKKAAGNRNYKGVLKLPRIQHLEQEKQPKKLLYGLLKSASGLKGRNLEKFNPGYATHLVADNISDFSPLRQLKAFEEFECDLTTVIDRILAINNE